MDLGSIDFGSMTIGLFITVWGAGWASCSVLMVKPLKARVEKMETKLESIETERNQELIQLRKLVHGK